MNQENIGLCGFTNKKSYFIDEEVITYINYKNSHNIKLELLDKNGNILKKYESIATIAQKYNKNSFAIGCDWKETFKFNFDSKLKSDLYFIKIYDNDNSWLIDVCLKNKLQNNKILVLSNVNTREAYNKWAGLDGEISLYTWNKDISYDSEYKDNISNLWSNFVSFNRPNTVTQNLKFFNFMYDKCCTDINNSNTSLIAELYGLKWLEVNSFDYDIITDIDLDKDPSILKKYKVFINFGHNEYWSINMIEGLKDFILNEGNFMNLAGNSLYWKCTIKNNQLEVRKSGDYHSHDNKPGGYWKYLESQISVSVFNLMGAYYSYGDDENNSYKYQITKKNHWAYKDINADFMGEDNLNISNNYGDYVGASGFEIDQIQIDKKYSIGEAFHIKKNITNDLIYYENNGKVFNSGSVLYSGSLLVDRNLSKFTKNILNNFITNEISDKNYEFNWKNAQIEYIYISTNENINLLNNTSDFNNWKNNQSVEIDISNKIIVTSKQNTSTPGLQYKNVIEVEPNSYYLFKINGYKKSDKFSVFPFIFDKDSNKAIFSYGKNDNVISAINCNLNLEDTNCEIIIQIPENVEKIILYVLFIYPFIGAEFVINSLSFSKINLDTSENAKKWHLVSFLNETINSYTCYKYEDKQYMHIKKGKLLSPNLGLWIRAADYISPEITYDNLKNSEIHRTRNLSDWNLVCFKDPTINSYTNCYKYEDQYVSVKKGEILKPGLAYWIKVSESEGNKIDYNLEILNMFKSKNHNNNLVAYSTKKSYYPEDVVDICTSVNNKILKDEIKSIKYVLFDINKNVILQKDSNKIMYQEYPYLGCINGCNWNISESLNLPSNLKSGMYIIGILCNKNVCFIPIVVKSKTKSKVLVISNINTWNAYELWAGYNTDEISAYKWKSDIESKYKYLEDGSHKSYVLSFDRPLFYLISKRLQSFIENNIYSHKQYAHLVYSELWMYKFLNDNDIDFNLINDIDMDQGESLKHDYKTIIIHAHPEYWTENALINLNKMTINGTNIAYFGGNGIYWRVTHKNNKMEICKDGKKHSHDNKKGGLWKDLQLDNNYLTTPKLLGVWFNRDKFNVIDLYPFIIIKKSHLFNGVANEFGVETLSTIQDDDGGISGWEVDDVISTSIDENEKYIIANAEKGADMLYIERENYKVFSGSTILWNAGLLIDKDIKKLTLNVINDFIN